MNVVTLQYDPLGLWVDNHPVLIPFCDSVLADAPVAYDLAEAWSTDAIFLDKTREFDYLVYLPSGLLATVRWCADRLGLHE